MAIELVEIPKTEDTKLRAEIEQLRRILPLMAEHVGLVATLRINSYRAHIAAGFTPEQALQLCK